jgi:hypothetical protein
MCVTSKELLNGTADTFRLLDSVLFRSRKHKPQKSLGIRKGLTYPMSNILEHDELSALYVRLESLARSRWRSLVLLAANDQRGCLYVLVAWVLARAESDAGACVGFGVCGEKKSADEAGRWIEERKQVSQYFVCIGAKL